MMDRYTARALVEQGQMSSEEYLRLFGEELRSARAQEEQRKREYAAQAAKANQEEAGQGAQRGPAQPILGWGE